MLQPPTDLQLKIAQRINLLLQRELAQGIDVPRMLAQPLYARDVLLVCDAVRGSDLAMLAQQFRDCGDDVQRTTGPVGHVGSAARSGHMGKGPESQSSAWPEDADARPSIWPQAWLRTTSWLRGNKTTKADKSPR